jgi:hypothetical protein
MQNLTLEIIKQRPLLFDGAMGTMLMKAGKTPISTGNIMRPVRMWSSPIPLAAAP